MTKEPAHTRKAPHMPIRSEFRYHWRMRSKEVGILGVWIVVTLLGCGESPRGAGPPGADGATTTTSGLLQIVDDMDHVEKGYPTLPTVSSAFFWPWPASRSGAVAIGNWFVSSPPGIEGDAHIDDIVPPRNDSKKACHVTGSGLERGTNLWAQLRHPEGSPVDLSAYSGVAFWARLDSPSGKLVVAMDPRGYAFFAAQSAGSPLPARTLSVSGQWEKFVLSFDDLGLTTPAAAASIDFVAGEGGESFDLWIDDLALVCRGDICP